MTQQTIGVGTVANDGTGDPARTAFQKVNANFTEIYAPVNGTILTPQMFGAVGNGIADDTAAFRAAETARPVGGVLVCHNGATYLLSGGIPITKAGSWRLNGATINGVPNGGNTDAGQLNISASNFSIDGAKSTFNYSSGNPALSLDRALRIAGGSIGAELTTGGNIAAGATSFIAGSAGDTVGLNADDWVITVLTNQADNNWLQVEYKQVAGVTGGTTVHVSVPYVQAFTAAGGGTGHLVHWAKVTPQQNVTIRDLTIVTSNAVAQNLAIDAQPGVIDLLIEGCTIDIACGCAVQLYGIVNPRFINNVVRQKNTLRHCAVSSTQGGRWSGNRIWNYGALSTVCGLTVETGAFGLRHDHNEYYGGSGGAGVIAVNNGNYCTFSNDLITGDGSALGIELIGSSNNTFSCGQYANLSFGIGMSNDASNPIVSCNRNLLVDNAFRNCTAGAIQVAATQCTGNSIIGLDYDASVAAPVIADNGTGTSAMYLRPGAGMTLKGPDSAFLMLFSGVTKAIRFGTDSSAAYLQAVDFSGAGSFQPLIVGGSTTGIGVGSTPYLNITTALSSFLNQLTLTTLTPASAGAAGTAGQITWDASFIYICVATNTWKRVAIATW